jgi:hypothetical protein
MFPPIFSQRRGEAQSRGEREIRNELNFQASQGSGKKQASSDEPESLASRICRTLEGVPRNGTIRGGNIKTRLFSSSDCVLIFHNTYKRQKAAALNYDLIQQLLGYNSSLGRANTYDVFYIDRRSILPLYSFYG